MKHYNLYYIFWEDSQNNLLSDEKKEKMRKVLLDFYRELKPPWIAPYPKKT